MKELTELPGRPANDFFLPEDILRQLQGCLASLGFRIFANIEQFWIMLIHIIQEFKNQLVDIFKQLWVGLFHSIQKLFRPRLFLGIANGQNDTFQNDPLAYPVFPDRLTGR